MRAMILAAGLGTRLQPLTNNLPKSLVKIHDKTLLEIAINNLVRNGFDKIIINVHHFAEQVIDFIGQNNFSADITISDERDKLLDTGGGLKKASQFFNDGKPFLLYNVDIISNLNLQTLYQDNIKSVAELQPDYLGFIFYEKSKRNFDDKIPEINNEIKKTGIFVNESIEFILEKIKEIFLCLFSGKNQLYLALIQDIHK